MADYEIKVLANLGNVTQGQVALAMLTDPSFVKDFKNGLESPHRFMSYCQALRNHVVCGDKFSLFTESDDTNKEGVLEYTILGYLLVILLTYGFSTNILEFNAGFPLLASFRTIPGTD